ncbi:MAG: transglutaminase domain-containing protein [Clostridia bacterium]|nr:transglutaminase domain-containing protein [Clostridia bacterium]
MNEKFKGKGMTVLIIILSLCIVASTVVSVCSLVSMGSLKKEVLSVAGGDGDIDQEDDITIMDQYKVESTLNISDAYKKGDDSSLNDKEKETLKIASDVLKEIIKKDMSDYEKEKAVYEWLLKNVGQDKGLLAVIPNSEADSDNPYGVLKYHNAVCVGYATTFRMFMQMMDIECKVIHSSDRGHTWDLVKLGDDWYHTDIYMDSNNGNYANFNMNDEMAESGHTWTKDFFPAAVGTKYCYAFMNMEKAKDIYGIPQVVKDKLDDGKYVFTIGFDKQPVDSDGAVVESMMTTIQDRVSMDYIDSYMEWSWHKDADGNFVLLVNIFISKDDTQQITPEQQDKIDKKINKAFGAGHSGDNSADNDMDANMEGDVDGSSSGDNTNDITGGANPNA